MRPKKIILLVDSDTPSGSAMAYALHIRGFDVLTACNADEALDMFWSRHTDIVLVQTWLPRGTDGFALVERMKSKATFIPAVLLGTKSELSAAHVADALLWSETPMEGLVEQIKRLTARKRGPRKGFGRKTAQGERTGPQGREELLLNAKPGPWGQQGR